MGLIAVQFGSFRISLIYKALPVHVWRLLFLFKYIFWIRYFNTTMIIADSLMIIAGSLFKM